jgi:hypothetical protein
MSIDETVGRSIFGSGSTQAYRLQGELSWAILGLWTLEYCTISTVGSPDVTCDRWTPPVHGFTGQGGL